MSKNVNVTQFIMLGIFAVAVAATFGIQYIYSESIKTWESLGSPPEMPSHFVAGYVGGYPAGSTYLGRETTIYVETLSGKIYLCCSTDHALWQEIPRNDVHEQNWVAECLRGKVDESRRHLENELDNYAIYWCGEADYGQAYYAIDKSGTIWVWKQYDRFPDNAVRDIILCSIGSGIGVVLASITGYFLARRKREQLEKVNA